MLQTMFNTTSGRDLLINYQRAQSVSKWPLCAYLLSAAFCMICSSVCHLCYVKDPKICDMVAKLDYWGIAVLFLGSAYPQVSYKYACGSMIVYRYVFVSLITACCAVCMYCTMKPKFGSPAMRVLVFFFFAVSFLVPILFL